MATSLITAAIVIIVAAGLCVLYLLPTVIGWRRGVPDLGVVAVLNLLLGWTLVGWVVALAMALRAPSTGAPAVQIVQNMPPASPPPPGHWPGAPPAGGSHPANRPASAAPPLHLPPGPRGRPAGPGDPDRE